jgi:hypothetical protein
MRKWVAYNLPSEPFALVIPALRRTRMKNPSKEQSIRFDRVPPQDVDSERALIGSLIQPVGTSEIIEKAIQIGVLPEIFYKKAHEFLCIAIYSLHEKESPVDLVTLSQELMSNGLLEQVGDVTYIDELLDATPTSVNMAYYAEIVIGNALKRSTVQQATKLYNDCFEHDVEIEYLIKQHTESLENLKELYQSKNNKKNGYTAKEISTMDIPESRWIVRNYVPEGLTLVAGAPKIGKSWFTLGLALATAYPYRSGIFLGSLPVENSGDVLYLALEDSIRRIKSRLFTLCKDNNFPDGLEFWTSIPTLSQGGVAKLEHWVQSKAKPRLIVIDVLEKIRDHAGAKFKNAYTEDYEDLGRLKTLADKTGISIVVVDHKRKADANDILDTISGSVGKQGAPDGLLIIRKARKESIGSLYRTGKDYDEDDEMAIKLDLDSGVGWSVIGNAEEIQLSSQRKAIVECLKSSNIPMTPKQIADTLGFNASYIRTTLRRLVEDKTISQYEFGKYVLNAENNH